MGYGMGCNPLILKGLGVQKDLEFSRILRIFTM
jgi:hypothetical protein